MRCHKPLSFWMMPFMRVPCLRGVADELPRSVIPPWLTFTSSRPSQCLSRISVCGFLSSPLIVLSKRLKLTRNVLVRHCLGRPEYGPCRVQIFFAQHFASTIRFERHNAVELQPITESGTRPLHGRSSVPYICLRRGYLGLRSTT